MGSVRLALCTGVLEAAALTPAAYAADGVSATPAPGTDVTLEVAECAERTAAAVSSAFVSEVRLTVALASSPAASPVAPVDAGGGGAARTVAAADESVEGPGTVQTVAGLFLAAAAATAAVVRSRVRRDRGTH
ncbi:hypothetical protein ACFWH4_24705 [Streptomyces sp. NPDC127091]|uniref:hypothetical protein n=1 Tax=Streptomyces sp. NPDC127091 TaxID=3347134 RepID=UPI00364D7C6A